MTKVYRVLLRELTNFERAHIIAKKLGEMSCDGFNCDDCPFNISDEDPENKFCAQMIIEYDPEVLKDHDEDTGMMKDFQEIVGDHLKSVLIAKNVVEIADLCKSMNCGNCALYGKCTILMDGYVSASRELIKDVVFK